MGFLIFINLYNFKSIYSIPASIISLLSRIKANLTQAINKYWPTHPKLPGFISKTLDQVNDTTNSLVEATPVLKDAAHMIAKEVKTDSSEMASRFTSIRKLYNDYVQSWFYTPSFYESSYSFFTDWKTYVGGLILIGIIWFFFGGMISNSFASTGPSTPSRGGRGGSHALDTPGGIEHPTMSEGFMQGFYKLFSDFVSNLPFVNNRTGGNRPRPHSDSDMPNMPTPPDDSPVTGSIISRLKGAYWVGFITILM